MKAHVRELGSLVIEAVRAHLVGQAPDDRAYKRVGLLGDRGCESRAPHERGCVLFYYPDRMVLFRD